MLEYDPRDPSQQQTGIPFDLLRRVREEEPVTQLKSGSWFVTRQAEVIPVLKDVETFRTDLGPLSGVGGVEDLDDHELFLSEILEPRHGKLRRLYNSCFGPHRVGRLEPFVEETCRALLDRMLAHDPADLHGEYALQIPSRVMARAMGLPDEAAAKFMEWSYDGTLMLRSVSPGIGEAGVPIQRYFFDALAERRAMSDPPDDVITFLLASEIDGEPLTDQEIATQLQFMVMAGVHTTRTLLTHLVHRLLEFPDVFAAVQQDRELVAPLIEESLRHDSPVPATSRRLTADTEVGGCPMHKGEWIEVGVMSANHDDAVYPDADVFLLDRPDCPRPPRVRYRPPRVPGRDAGPARGPHRGERAARRPRRHAPGRRGRVPAAPEHARPPADPRGPGADGFLRAGEEPFPKSCRSLTRPVSVPMGGYVRNGWGLVVDPSGSRDLGRGPCRRA